MNDAKFDVVQSWLDNVAYSHSGSLSTRTEYERNFTRFCHYITKSPEDILREYEDSSDRQFKRKFAQYLKAWISQLLHEGHTKSSIHVMVASVKSFCKYSDLPLGYVPLGNHQVVYHNRDITKEEITDFMSIANARDRAFFCVMAQSGLRPNTLCQLRLKHLEPDFSNGTIPCKINIPQELAKGKYHSYFTFIGEESTHHLKSYFKTRSQLSRGSLVFTKIGTDQPLNPKVLSVQFHDYAEKLRQKGVLDFERKKKGKPATIRLYNLRKYFRKYANHAGFEYVEFWMGHKGPGVDSHYRPTDAEFHRALYKEKAMPYLRLEHATPTDTEKIIEQQAQEIENLKTDLQKIQPLLTWVNGFQDKTEMQRFLDSMTNAYSIRTETDEGDVNGVFVRFDVPKELVEELRELSKKTGKGITELTLMGMKRGIARLKKEKGQRQSSS